MIKKTILLAALTFLPLAAVDTAAGASETLQPVTVRVTAPRSGSEPLGYTVQGRTEPALAVSVSARSEGIFHSEVTLAQAVKRGERIGELRDPVRTLQIKNLEARIGLLASQYALERKKTEQSREMLTLGILSENAVLAQESALNDRQLLLQQARSDLARLQLLQKARQILAPADGFIETLAPEGGYIAYGAQVAALTSKRVMVRLFVAPRDAEHLKRGQTTTLLLSGREVPAAVTSVLPTGSGNLVDVIAEPAAPLPAGLALSARIETARATGWLLPKSAVVLEQNRPAVFLAEGNVARLHFVTVRKEMLDQVLVDAPFDPKESVIVDKAYMLRDGTRIEVAP